MNNHIENLIKIFFNSENQIIKENILDIFLIFGLRMCLMKMKPKKDLIKFFVTICTSKFLSNDSHLKFSLNFR